jgi:hypothetical protein
MFKFIFLYKELDPTKIWYDEINEYDWINPGFLINTEHFTQLIWKSTTEVGFGVAIGLMNEFMICAIYFPAGKII